MRGGSSRWERGVVCAVGRMMMWVRACVLLGARRSRYTLGEVWAGCRLGEVWAGRGVGWVQAGRSARRVTVTEFKRCSWTGRGMSSVRFGLRDVRAVKDMRKER